jgi:RND family efflux transporter MFP subunit
MRGVFTKRNSWLLLVVTLVALAAGYFAWSERLGGRCSGWHAADAVPVKIERVSRGTMPYALQASGELRPLKEANVATRLPGIVKAVRYKVGDSVSQGAIVAVIEPTELLQRVARVEANLTAVRTQSVEKERQLLDAEKQLQEIKELVKQDLIAKRELDRAHFAVDTARAQVEVAMAQVAQQEAMLTQSRKVLGLSRLTAPFSGIVTDVMVEPGSKIGDSTAILTIASLDVLTVTIRVPQDLNLVREGMVAEVRVNQSTAEVLYGKIARLASEPDSSGARLAEVDLPNRNHRLKPGITVAVWIRADDGEEVLFAPSSAVLHADEKDYVYAVVDGRAQRKEILKSGEKAGRAAIKSGLSEGEWVVASGQEHVKPGDIVPLVGGHDSCQKDVE